ncbi:ATP-binding protein [Heliorestis acidaminivorans]|nr:ATP-binding protein [Heliorestis acidaminivorans]
MMDPAISKTRIELDDINLALLNMLGGALLILDLQGRFVFLNAMATQLLGWSTEEIYGHDMEKIFGGPLDSTPLKAMLTAQKDGISEFYRDRDSFFIRKDRETISVAYVVTPLYCEEERTGLIVQFRDIREEKEQANKLREAKEFAESSNRDKSKFLAIMSHEIRTPMSGIIGMTDLLLESSLNKEQYEYAQAVRDSSTMLLQIINDILDFSKIEAYHMHLEDKEFDLPTLLETIIYLLSSKAQRKGLKLKVDIDPKAHQVLCGDPIRLRQILFNLLGNAIKFTKHGNVILRVEVKKEATDKSVIGFEVSDTGMGIRKAHQDKIFLPFYQANDVGSHHNGTGLGLAICQKLVVLMGGTIDVESEEGHGTTFKFAIPFGKCKEKDNRKTTESIEYEEYLSKEKYQAFREKNKKSADQSIRILLVEDNLINQRLVTCQLKKLGYQVDSVFNGQEALQALLKHRYHLILMDCQMPVMDGYETTRKIRHLEQGESHIPIIAITARAMNGDRDECIDSGMDDYLSKPFNVQQLKERLDKWLALEQR